MLKIENVEVLGWEHAIRGMRNPKNSWEKSDSGVCATHGPAHCADCVYTDCHADDVEIGTKYILGPNDLDLMTRLRNAGTDHRKFMRMITVYLDITAPLYWWKEFDTYKVGTVADSCSTMHKIAAKEFTLDDFSHEHLIGLDLHDEKHDYVFENLTVDCSGCKDGSSVYSPLGLLDVTVEMLNKVRSQYLAALKTESETGFPAKDIWWQMIQLLPSSYNQKRTVMLNYEVLANIYKSRRNHKLDEWHTFCDWIESLPYSELITGKQRAMANIVTGGDKTVKSHTLHYKPRNLDEVVRRKDLINFVYRNRVYKNILGEVALTKDEYTINEVADLLGTTRKNIKRWEREGKLKVTIPYTAFLDGYKKESAKIANELGYGEQVMEMIEEASSEFEVDRILASARHKEERYFIGSAV